MLTELVALAHRLDKEGHTKDADLIDQFIISLAGKGGRTWDPTKIWRDAKKYKEMAPEGRTINPSSMSPEELAALMSEPDPMPGRGSRGYQSIMDPIKPLPQGGASGIPRVTKDREPDEPLSVEERLEKLEKEHKELQVMYDALQQKQDAESGLLD
jgi:hypothetical protein